MILLLVTFSFSYILHVPILYSLVSVLGNLKRSRENFYQKSKSKDNIRFHVKLTFHANLDESGPNPAPPLSQVSDHDTQQSSIMVSCVMSSTKVCPTITNMNETRHDDVCVLVTVQSITGIRRRRKQKDACWIVASRKKKKTRTNLHVHHHKNMKTC